MTGQCYWCAGREHWRCRALDCTCCGERNREQKQRVDELEKLIKDLLSRGKPLKPPTGTEWNTFLSPEGAPDDYDHDREEELHG